jgi:hypothetical protein
MMEEAPFNHYEVHCTPANTEQCDNGRLIDLTYIKDLDQHWMDYSIDFIKRMKDGKQPFFLYHATRGCHFDNYPSDEWAGKSRARTVYSDCMVHMDYVLSELVKALEETGQMVRSAKSRRMPVPYSAAAKAPVGKAVCVCRPSRTGKG